MTTVEDVTVDQAAALAEDGALVLDVREPEEWAEGHISGAHHMPLGELDPAAISRDSTVIAVCRSGNRSSKAAAILAEAGHEVVNMQGGMNAWTKAGLPVVTDTSTPGAP